MNFLLAISEKIPLTTFLFAATSANTPDGNPCLFVLFDLILYVHSTIFQLCRTVLPGFNQY